MSTPPKVVDPELSFATRNPLKDINPPRVRHRETLTDAQKVSAEARRQINKENSNALQEELEKFMEIRSVEITRLAKKFNKSEVKIKQLLTNSSNYKNTRAPSLRNALVFAKGVEMNEDRVQGDRLKLSDIQKLVDEDPSMQNLSDTRKNEYLEDLQIYRETKKSGARTSNLAAAVDCRSCIVKVTEELRNLSERTGMCALAFFTRTHIHDGSMPTWVDSDDAIAFVSEVLGLDPMDFLTKFEQWACARSKASTVQETLHTLRCDCTRLVSNGLRLILNLKNVRMCYVNYEIDIVTKHKVELVGWPASIKFANPSEIGTIEDIRKLRQALKVGECKWIAQSRGQQAAYAQNLARKAASGEQVVKKRKQRSDKGKQRKKAVSTQSGNDKEGDREETRNNGDNDEEESRQPPKKKRKYGAASKTNLSFHKMLPPAAKSKAFIVDSDAEEDSDGEDDNDEYA